MSQIKIDYTQIPPADLKNLCRTLTAAVIKFYDDPKNRERFERWQKSRSEEGKSLTEKSESNNATVCDSGAGCADYHLQPRNLTT